MKHHVYKTTNTVTGEYYIGVHSCKGKSCYHYKNRSSSCEYLGSGLKLLNSIKKHGKACFTRTNLSTFTSRKDAFEQEKKLVNLYDPLSLNLAEGGQGDSKPWKLKGTHPNCKEVTYEGKTYSSIVELADTYGTSPEHASKWARGLTHRDGNLKPITIEGVTYISQAEAERRTGYANKTIRKFRDPSYEKKKAPTRPVSVLGVVYATTGEAAKAHSESVATVRYRCLAKTRKFKDWFYV